MYVDIDESSTSSYSCDVNAVCSNTVGCYACACKAGFTGDENTCTAEPFNWYVCFLSKPATTQQYNILYLYSSCPSNNVLARWEKKITVEMTAWSKRTDKRCQAVRLWKQ